MSELAAALAEPQVIVAFITFVVAPIIGVLISAARETNDPVQPPSDKAKTQVGDKRIRKDDVIVIEAFAQWADTQQQEIRRLKTEMGELRSQMSEMRRINITLRQHNEVLMTQLRRAGEQPFPAPGHEDAS